MFARHIPYWKTVHKWIFILTAVGVVIHEYAHKHMAKTFGLKIHEVSYFQLSGEAAGYVKHDTPRTYTQMAAVSLAPFVFNSAIAYLCFGVVAGYLLYTPIETLETWELALMGATVWVGFSSGFHAFPSSQDINNVWEAAKGLWKNTTIPILQPVVYKIKSLHILFKILLSPLWLIIVLIRGVVFSIRNYIVIVSLPFLLLLVLLNKLRALGSNYLFTGLIAWSVYESFMFLYPELGL